MSTPAGRGEVIFEAKAGAVLSPEAMLESLMKRLTTARFHDESGTNYGHSYHYFGMTEVEFRALQILQLDRIASALERLAPPPSDGK